MITNWRNDWNQGDFPFYLVQIAPFNYGGLNAAYLRHAQLKTMLSVPQTGMVVTSDIGECYDIHPREKRIVGERLALWALAKDYHIAGFAYSGPVYRSMTKKDSRIVLQFDHAQFGMTSLGEPLTGFEVAGSDKIFHKAKAKFSRNGTVEVWSDSILKPEAVRYDFKNCATGNLYNVSRLPASPFRTDSWSIEDVEAKNN
jgi:sialate O-acetylesterase